MAAITKRLLHLRSNLYSNARPHLYPFRYFSSSSDPDAQPDPNSGAQTRPSLSSSFDSVKASLHQQPPPQIRESRASSTDDIHRHLSEYGIRSAAPPPSSAGKYTSMQELYERNVNSNVDNSANSSGINSGGKRSSEFRFRQPSPGGQNDSGRKFSYRLPLSENLKLKGDAKASGNSTMSIGGSNSYMASLLGGRGRDYQDLGKNLKMLRPQNRNGKWFSLQELNDRLSKLREAQKKENTTIHDIRGAISGTEPQKAPKRPLNNLGILGLTGGIESYDMLPRKEDLIEKYFHPYNLSSAEKLKLELKKVKDEFKMSESDCGSARVQVAQLTLKIKHLSTVLQKKDKHSRRGLQAMVQRRKKLLKYLRRTDWDSYCLILSKLGLRDNPDIKA